MRAARIACITALALCLLGAAMPKRPPGLGDVTDVRTWSHPDYTRVVVELDRAIRVPDVKRLAANPKAGRPERLYLDLGETWVGRDYADGIPVGDGLLEAVRLGQNTLRNSRLVIDLARYDRHRLLTLRSPHRRRRSLLRRSTRSCPAVSHSCREKSCSQRCAIRTAKRSSPGSTNATG